MEKSIGFVGPANYDVHYVVEKFPGEGFLTSIRSSFVKLGGLCNVMGQMSKLDPSVPLLFLGPLGRDERGRYMRRAMCAAFPHLDCSRAVDIDENPYTIIFNSRETKERTFFSKAVTGEECGSADVDIEGCGCSLMLVEYMLDDSWLDHRDGETGLNGATILRNAQRKGMKTFVDLCSRSTPDGQEICRRTFPFVDYCVINEIETECATGIQIQRSDGSVDDALAEKALFRLREMGVSTWASIHTRGWGFVLDGESGTVWKMPSLPLPRSLIVEKTGAGDAFLSGILYAVWKGWSADRALVLSSAAAASSLSGHDGYETVGSVEETFAFYDRYRGDSEPVRM